MLSVSTLPIPTNLTPLHAVPAAAEAPASSAASWAHKAIVPAAAIACWALDLGSATALLLGVAVALCGANAWEAQTARWSKRLLALSVVGLGAGLNLYEVFDVGVFGASFAVLSIGFCLATGALLARCFRVDAVTGLLVACGTAICGGSAIAAVAPTVRAEEHQVTAALGTVFLLNAVALVLFPLVGDALDLDAQSFGLWCAIAIHDTSSVVGAAMTHGEEALEIATTVKLSRALWIIPVTLVLAYQTRKRMRASATEGDVGEAEPKAARPWFILGFVVVAALVTFIPSFAPVGETIGAVARRLLVVTLFLIGASLGRAALKRVGVRPFLQGVTLWAIVSAASLAAILAFA